MMCCACWIAHSHRQSGQSPTFVITRRPFYAAPVNPPPVILVNRSIIKVARLRLTCKSASCYTN